MAFWYSTASLLLQFVLRARELEGAYSEKEVSKRGKKLKGLEG